MASHVWDVWTSHVKSSWHIKLTIRRICHFPILYLLQEGYIKCYGWPTFLVYSDISNYHSSWKLKVKVYCYFKTFKLVCYRELLHYSHCLSLNSWILWSKRKYKLQHYRSARSNKTVKFFEKIWRGTRSVKEEMRKQRKQPCFC